MTLQSRQASVLVFVCLVAATAFTLDTLLSTREIPCYRDLLFFTVPFKDFLAEHLRRGRIPLWNPGILMGTPYLANLQSATFYPLSALLVLDFPLGFNLFLFAHYLVALTGSWVWLRGRNLSIFAAAVGASVFTLGGYLVSAQNVTNHLHGAVWAPWFLFFWSRYVRARSRAAVIALVVCLSIQLLGGSPESLLMTLSIALAWAIYDRFPSTADVRKLVWVLAGILLLVTGVCAVQLFPTVEYLSHSDRAASLSREEVMHWSLQSAGLIQLLLPHSSDLLPAAAANSLGPGFERTLALIHSPYLGIGTLCFGVVGLAYGRERRFWGAVVFAAVVLALGDRTPVLPALYDWLPQVFGKFRYPEKFFFVVHLAAAVLAAEGTERIVRRDPKAERMAWIMIAALALAVAPLYLLRWFSPVDYLRLLAILSGKYLPPSEFVSLGLDVFEKVKRLALILTLLGSILLLRRSVLSGSTSQLLLGSLVVVDLASVNRHLNLAVDWPNLLSRRPLVDASALRASQQRIFHFRLTSPAGEPANPASRRLTRWIHSIDASQNLAEVYGALWETLYANAGMLYGIANVSGGDGIARATDTRLYATLAQLPVDRAVALLRAYGTAYLIGPDALNTAGVDELTADHATPYHAYRIHDPLPFAHAVSRLSIADAPSEVMQRLAEPSFRPADEAIVERLPPEWRDTPSTASVEVLGRADGALRIAVRADSAAFVVINQSYFPGWQAQIDGLPATIYRTNAIVQGIPVAAGSHTIELDYRPTSFAVGAYVSLGSVLVLAALTLRALRLAAVHAR